MHGFYGLGFRDFRILFSHKWLIKISLVRPSSCCDLAFLTFRASGRSGRAAGSISHHSPVQLTFGTLPCRRSRRLPRVNGFECSEFSTHRRLYGSSQSLGNRPLNRHGLYHLKRFSFRVRTGRSGNVESSHSPRLGTATETGFVGPFEKRAVS